MVIRHIVSILCLAIPFVVIGQTQLIQGTIKDYTGKQYAKVHVATWQTTGYAEAGVADVQPAGQFEMALAEAIKPSVCIMYFENGDTVLFVGGTDKVLQYKARWYEGYVVDNRFEGSAENDLFRNIRSILGEYKDAQDSIARAGAGLNEFDKDYQANNTYLREALQDKAARFNDKLNKLRLQHASSYCARAIIPVILKAVYNQDTILSKTYDTNRAFQHHHFFSKLSADTLLVTTPFLREKINEYMNFWVGQTEKKYTDGVDIVVRELSRNEAIRKYAVSTLTDYFTDMNHFQVVDYLYSNYISTCEAPPLQGRSAAIVEQMKRLAKGNKAPELIMPDDKGNYFWLSQMKTRKYVVLFFWASWCQHCQEMMPDVVKYYNDAKAKGVDIVAVSLDDNKEQWQSFVAKNKLSWTNISDLKHWDSEAVRLYALRATPTFYVLDSSLNIIGRTNELDELKAMTR